MKNFLVFFISIFTCSAVVHAQVKPVSLFEINRDTENTNLEKSQGILTLLEDYSPDRIEKLATLYKVPLVIIADKVYLPQNACLDSRKVDGDTEDRKLGGDTENRKLGGDTENRKLGGDIENRKLGGDTENRKLGGDTENRKLGGDTENRKLGGDTENRKLGGDTENRKLGGDTENRKLGGDIENRKLGGDTENRKLDGDTENRKLDGDTAVIQCYRLEDRTGFKILNLNPNAEVFFYFKGKLQRALNFNIEY
jgi:hypothetical protein